MHKLCVLAKQQTSENNEEVRPSPSAPAAPAAYRCRGAGCSASRLPRRTPAGSSWRPVCALVQSASAANREST